MSEGKPIKVGKSRGNRSENLPSGARFQVSGLAVRPKIRKGKGGYFVEGIARGRTVFKLIRKPRKSA